MTKERIILYSAIIILLGILMYQCSRKPDVIKIPIKIEVPIPVVEVEFETINNPYPVYIPGKKEIDSIYYDRYMALKDSAERNEVFKDAITIREYKETVEDDTITINLYAKVQGHLKEYQIGYKTKPRTITHKDEIEVPIDNKLQFGAGMELGFPTAPNSGQGLVLKPKIAVDTKNIIYEMSYDTEKRGWLGLIYKF